MTVEAATERYYRESPKEFSNLELRDLAEVKLCKRLDKGGLCELIDGLTTNIADMEEFEANLWAYLKESKQALRLITDKYISFHQEELEEELSQEPEEECFE